MKLGDWLAFISFLLIIAAMFMFAYHSYTSKVNECTSDPIRFGVEKIRTMYKADVVSGSMFVIADGKQSSWFIGDGAEYNNNPNGDISKMNISFQ